MKRYKLSIIVLLFVVQLSAAAVLCGKITDVENNAVLSEVNIQIQGQETGAVSRLSGNYALPLSGPGDYQIAFSYIGYETVVATVNVESDKDLVLDIQMQSVPLSGNQVVVTSTRYAKAIKDVSQPLAVVTSKLIEEQQPVDVSAALETKPGLSVTRDGVWGSQVAIRGLSKSNIVTLVDGNRIDTATDLAAGLSMIDVNDIERIEVIKGAASALYGTGAVGGVINVITKDGWYSEKPYLLESIAGGFSTVNNQSMGQIALQAGATNWYARVSGMTRDAENVQTPDGELPNSQFQDQNLSAKAGVRFLDKHEIKINYQKFNAKDVGIPGGSPLFPDVADVTYPEEERELFSVTYGMDVHAFGLSKWSVKYFKQDILRDVLNVPHKIQSLPGKNVNVLSVVPRATHDTQGIQLQTDWLLAKSHYIVAGLDVWQKDLESHRKKNLRIDVLNDANEVVNSISQVIGEDPLPISFYRSMGVFIQDEFTVNHKLSLSIGGRIDQIHVENDQVLNPAFVIVNGTRNDAPANQIVLWDATTADDRSWSGNLGALYHLTHNLDLSLSLARSFRSPYLEERYSYIDLGSLVKIGDPDLEPEKGDFADMGIRLWFDNWSFVGNVFYNRMKNLVVEAPGIFEDRNALIKTNVGKAELYGFDMQLDYKFNEHFNLFGNLAYVHGHDNFADAPLPLVPPLNGKLGISGNTGYGFNYHLLAGFYGKQDRTASWEVETPGYTVFNLYLSTKVFKMFTIDGQMFTGVENLTDKSYRNHLSTNRGLIAVEPGRNFIFRLQLSR